MSPGHCSDRKRTGTSPPAPPSRRHRPVPISRSQASTSSGASAIASNAAPSGHATRTTGWVQVVAFSSVVMPWSARTAQICSALGGGRGVERGANDDVAVPDEALDLVIAEHPPILTPMRLLRSPLAPEPQRRFRLASDRRPRQGRSGRLAERSPARQCSEAFGRCCCPWDVPGYGGDSPRLRRDERGRTDLPGRHDDP